MSFGSPYLTLPEFRYHRPSTINEVIDLLKEYGDEAKIMGGGIGLLSFMKERLMNPKHIIDIKSIRELKRLEYSPGKGLIIGAAVTLSELERSDVVKKSYRALYEAISNAADPIIRNRATLVGNLCEAIPWVDSPSALIALDGSVDINGPEGKRRVKVESFIKGTLEIDLSNNEFVEAILLPDNDGSIKSVFEKFSTGSEFSLANVAIAMSDGRERYVRIVYGAVSSTPVRSKDAEVILMNEGLSQSSIAKVAKAASRSIECMSDILASSDYRKHLIQIITAKALRRLLE